VEEVARPSSRRRALVVPAAGLLLGGAYTLGALQYPAGSLEAPATGLFPLLVGVLLVASSLIALITEWRNPSVESEPVGPSAWRVPALVLVLLAASYLLQVAGFLATGAVLCALVLAIAGRRRVWSVIVIACAISGATALGFRLLGVPLPGVPL
jgi:hypothetical protein